MLLGLRSATMIAGGQTTLTQGERDLLCYKPNLRANSGEIRASKTWKNTTDTRVEVELILHIY